MNAGENQIVVYQPNETVRLDVRLENETVWLTQEQIANLFGTKRPAITKHLANIYKSGELEREGTCSILEHMGNDGRQSYRTMFYNLDAILSVGYRVNSRNATLFRRWATQVLKSYLLKGYAINARLNQLEDKIVENRSDLNSTCLRDGVYPVLAKTSSCYFHASKRAQRFIARMRERRAPPSDKP